MNPVIECLLNHRSVRQYLDRPVEPEVLDIILKGGTLLNVLPEAGMLLCFGFLCLTISLRALYKTMEGY